MPKPYYSDDWTTVYHGDCREILPALKLPASGLILTDPPYGAGFVHHGKNYAHASKFAGVEVEGDDQPFDPGHLLALKPRKKILWGGNHYGSRLPDSAGWLVWDKRETETNKKAMSDCELAWTSFLGGVRRFFHLWDGFNKRSERGERRIHPTQKPVALMRWCIILAGSPALVVDPYMGSGSTLRAAKDLGLRSIGIESDERYLPGAVRRLTQETLWDLFNKCVEAGPNGKLFETNLFGARHEQKENETDDQTPEEEDQTPRQMGPGLVTNRQG